VRQARCCGLHTRCGRKSALRVDRSNIYNKINFPKIAATWFNGFFQLLSENCQRGGLQARLQGVAVISFNYDRCLEHFLHKSLKNYYSVSAGEAAELLTALEIYHPYGTVGPLPWSNAAPSIDYGGRPCSRELNDLADKLRTFTEGTDEASSDIIKIRATLRSAERTVFLGFAFHPLDLELLYGSKTTLVSARSDKAYATAIGLSESNAELVASDLSTMAGYALPNILLRRDLTASQLVRDFWRSLSIRP
jgi:hypothetical protein